MTRMLRRNVMAKRCKDKRIDENERNRKKRDKCKSRNYDRVWKKRWRSKELWTAEKKKKKI